MIPRLAATTLQRFMRGFPVVTVTGPRQSGKAFDHRIDPVRIACAQQKTQVVLLACAQQSAREIGDIAPDPAKPTAGTASLVVTAG
mgnify:CR=1 FL=1